jgi:REP-associated tyrosine transposase
MAEMSNADNAVWYCQYHIVFVPKYRYRILTADIGKFVYRSIYADTERCGCEIVELNVLEFRVSDSYKGES